MTNRVVKLIPFVVLLLMAFDCEDHLHKYAPVVRNTLNRPTIVSVVYANGQSNYGIKLAPGAHGYAPAEGIGVREISVRADGKILFTIKQTILEDLRAQLPPDVRVVWEIHEDGVMPKEFAR